MFDLVTWAQTCSSVFQVVGVSWSPSLILRSHIFYSSTSTASYHYNHHQYQYHHKRHLLIGTSFLFPVSPFFSLSSLHMMRILLSPFFSKNVSPKTFFIAAAKSLQVREIFFFASEVDGNSAGDLLHILLLRLKSCFFSWFFPVLLTYWLILIVQAKFRPILKMIWKGE